MPKPPMQIAEKIVEKAHKKHLALHTETYSHKEKTREHKNNDKRRDNTECT